MKTLQQLGNKVTSVFRSDNWVNSSTGLGLLSGRVGNTRIKGSTYLSYSDLSEMYYGNGLAKRIVNSFVDDALRNGFLVCGNDKVKDAFKKLALPKVIKEACYFSRLYGGSIIVAFLDDGLDLKEPVSDTRINKIISFRVFDKSQISWQEADLNRDFLSPNFALPEFYTITSFKNSADTSILKIHASRCKVLDGITTSHLKRRTNLGWGDSVLQACYDSLRYYGIVAENSSEIINDFIQVIIKMNGLAHQIIKEGGKEAVAARMDAIDVSRSNSNLIFLDAEKEDYEKKSSSVSGLADLWDRFSESVCAATGYPATRLFGRSPGGLNSTGDSDLKNYYDLVSAYRSDEIEPIINWILNFITHQQEWGSDKDIEWSFASLVEQTPLEDAKLKKLYAEIDWGYIDRGAIDAGSTWQERFGKGEFQENIQLKQLERDADFTDLEELEIISDLKKEESQIKEESNTERKAKKVLDSVFNSL